MNQAVIYLASNNLSSEATKALYLLTQLTPEVTRVAL